MVEGPFVPSGFVVPLALTTEQFRLEPLGPQHNDSDYEAWSSSVEHIHMTPGWETSSWPDDRSLADNLRDLQAARRRLREQGRFYVHRPRSCDRRRDRLRLHLSRRQRAARRACALMGAGEPARARRAAVAGGHRLARGRVAVRACGLRRARRRRLTLALPADLRSRSDDISLAGRLPATVEGRYTSASSRIHAFACRRRRYHQACHRRANRARDSRRPLLRRSGDHGGGYQSRREGARLHRGLCAGRGRVGEHLTATCR